MFKELKVIKLLILVSLLTGIIFKMDFSNLAIQELYTDQPSYNRGDTVKIYCSSQAIFPFNLNIDVTDLSGKMVTSINLPIKTQKPSSQNILQNGLNYKKYTEFIIPYDFKSGIYLINNKYPLVVKSKEKSAITVVYPFMNNIIYQPVNQKSVFTEKTPTTSFKRTCLVDNYTKGMSEFFSYLDTTYRVNYINDLDLEKDININQSRLLIVYGKSTFWTPKMVNSLTKFQENGGNTLNITSYFSNNICWHKNENEITLIDSTQTINSWHTYDTIMPLTISGTAYNRGGYSDNKDYLINTQEHPIFKGVNKSKIKIDANLFSAPPIFWNKDIPFIDFYKLQFYSGEILAYSDASYQTKKGVKGIFALRRTPTSGKVISLGTDGWCLEKNIGKKKQLQKITKNAVVFLLE